MNRTEMPRNERPGPETPGFGIPGPDTPRPYADLHTHSNISDGTDSPAELITHAVQAGLDWVALTDHDTHAGWDAAQAQAQKLGIGLICGTEVSTQIGGHSVHLLAYGYRPDGALDQIISKARDSRIERAQRITQNLAADYRIDWAAVQDQTDGDHTTIGRPHIADALVAAGEFPDRKAVFDGPLDPKSKYYAPYWAPTPADAIAAVRECGGVPVIAHPYSQTRDFQLPEAEVAKMVEAGLLGIERDHRDHGLAQRAQVDEIAARYGLWKTGSSDYHGTGKPNRLGENLTDPEVLEQIISACAVGIYPPSRV